MRQCGSHDPAKKSGSLLGTGGGTQAIEDGGGCWNHLGSLVLREGVRPSKHCKQGDDRVKCGIASV